MCIDLFSICCAPNLSSWSSSSSAISSVMYGSTTPCRDLSCGRVSGRGTGARDMNRRPRTEIRDSVEPREPWTAGWSSSHPGTVQAVGLRLGGDGARNDRRGATNAYGSRYTYISDARALLEHCIELTARRFRVSRATVAGGVCARDNRRYAIYRVNAGTAAAAEFYVLSSARVRIMRCVFARTTRARSRVFKRYWSRP